MITSPQSADEAHQPPDNIHVLDIKRPKTPDEIAQQERPHLRVIPNSGGIYKFPGKSGFYIRPIYKGRLVQKKLKATTLSAAKDEWADIRAKLAKFHAEIGKDPFAKELKKSLEDLCDGFLKAGCPRQTNGAAPQGKQLKDETKRVGWLKKFAKEKHIEADQMRRQDADEYHKWRTKFITRGSGGDRTVDLELTTLSNIFTWAMLNDRRTGITQNPFAQRKIFRDPNEVRHCRDNMPRDFDQVNAYARYCFDSYEREVYGWLILFQSMIGHRIHELLKLRMDAKTEDDAGFWDGKILHLFRSKTSKGTYGHIAIRGDDKRDRNPELALVVEAHRAWHKQRFPNGNDFYFPSYYGGGCVREDGLTKVLDRAVKAIHGKETTTKITSHGLRAYRVNVMRSQGWLDAEIAIRIGQKSGEKLIIKVYGEGLKYKIGYTPKDGTAPAWEKWLPEKDRTVPIEQGDLV